MRRLLAFLFPLSSFLLLTGCDWMPGAPKANGEWQPKTADLDFTKLYRQNCIACHSDGESVSASIPMNFPLYLHLVPPETLRQVIEQGIPGTTMPAFAQSVGGSLTPQQVDVLIGGIAAWKTGAPPADLPPYAAPLGDVAAGATAYAVHCASCHGPNGQGGPNGPILDPAYLGLVSDQYLRTITIVGHPQLGMPPWNQSPAGRPLTDQEIADVVAWMASHRKTPTPQPSDLRIQ